MARATHTELTKQLGVGHGCEKQSASDTGESISFQFYTLNVITTKVSKIASHCAGSVQMREESGSVLRK